MGTIKAPKPVKLFVGMLSGDRDLMRRAGQLVSKEFGEVDIESGYWPFEHTNYYLDELGPGVEKHFVSFRQAIQPETLTEIKRHTNDIEQRICSDVGLPPGRRPVNLDPGYISLSKVVLATTKDHAHRIYLQRGIYAEVTLRFHDGKWQPWPWTYTDYATGQYDEFFMAMREVLKASVSAARRSESGANESG